MTFFHLWGIGNGKTVNRLSEAGKGGREASEHVNEQTNTLAAVQLLPAPDPQSSEVQAFSLLPCN